MTREQTPDAITEEMKKAGYAYYMEASRKFPPMEIMDFCTGFYQAMNNASLRKSPTPDGWRGIDTLPTDGTAVDLWVEMEEGQYRFTDCFFDKKNSNWYFSGPGYHLSDYQVAPRIIAWMPVPSNPETIK